MILVVDDEALIAELYASALEDAGFAAQVFLSADEAMAWIEGEDAQCAGIVTDINLGHHYRGWDLATRAREANPNAAVVYCTGFEPSEWAEGVPDSVILTKPFALAQLVVALANQLNAAEVRGRE